MLKTLFRLIVCAALIALASWQGDQLFQEWVKVPRKDLNAWRIEYATINLNQSEATELTMQTRTMRVSRFKKNAIPNLKITLTNSNDDVIESQELKPNEWLPQEILQDNHVLLYGIAPDLELTIQIPMKIPQAATGYRIQFIFH